MTLDEACNHIADILKNNKAVVVSCDPEDVDFINSQNFKLIISGLNKTVKLNLEPTSLLTVMGILAVSIFAQNINVIGWNIKPLFTYVLYHTKKAFVPDANIWDLKLLESYLDIHQDCPTDLLNGMQRFKLVASSSSWAKLAETYGKVYYPLISKVLPAIEATGLVDEKDKKIRHPWYEVEGQKNGRLLCKEPFNYSYNPHVMKAEDRMKLVSRFQGENFLYFDYEHMEVSVLQWLCQDQQLGEILKKDDVYATIYERVTGERNRDLGKKLFLPIIYGESANTLAQVWGIDTIQANNIVHKLKSLFPTTFAWIDSQQRHAEQGVLEDFFKRKRIFKDNFYKARNFVVQSPASLICLEKLVVLHERLRNYGRVAFHCHDGYAVSFGNKDFKDVYKASVESLEGESSFCPGLKLTVNVKGGRHLSELIQIHKKKG